MNVAPPQSQKQQRRPTHGGGIAALCAIASELGITADPQSLVHQLGVDEDVPHTAEDLLRAAKLLGLRAKLLRDPSYERFCTLPTPALISFPSGWAILGARVAPEKYLFVDPLTERAARYAAKEIFEKSGREIILVAASKNDAPDNDEAFAIRWFLSALWRYRRSFAHVLLASFFIQIFALVTPLVFQMVIDKVLVYKSEATLIVLVVALVGLAIFDAVMKYLRSYALIHTSSRVDVELAVSICQRLFSLPISYFEQRPAGVTVARMREIETIRDFLTGQALSSLVDLAFIFVFIGVMFLYSTTLSVIVVLSIPAYIAAAVSLRPIILSRIQQKFDRWSYSQQFIVESVVGVQTIKAAAVEPLVSREWGERVASYVRSSFSASMSGALAQTIIEFMTKLVTALLLYFGAREVVDGSLTVGGLIAFNMISNQVTSPILRLSQLWQSFQQVQVSVERLGDIMNAEPEERPTSSAPQPPVRGGVTFHNVSFRYKPELPDAVKEVSLEIRPGERIGIVGASGSGKSTLTKLLQRFYQPLVGKILVDDVDISKADPFWLRRQLGVVLQENLLFNRTIHENIAIARPNLPRGHVRHVARLAGADDFIDGLPLGYDTLIEERGANLSGGQRQRIAIARALATDPKILILDEATSALDYESERIIQSNMRQISAGRTVIIIAHRLAAVRDCDRIVGMAQGEIKEVGAHDELIQRNGIYARLWALQNSKGVE